MNEMCATCSHKASLYDESDIGGVPNTTLIGEYCSLNECKYEDLEFDLREIYKKIAEIIREYDDDLNRSTGFERIKELIDGVTSTHSSTGSSTEIRGCNDCMIIREYLSKCEQYGCDSCVADTYCILNNLRTDRYPGEMCEKNLLGYLDSRKEIHNNISPKN